MIEISAMEIVSANFDLVFERSTLMKEVARDWGEYAFRYKLDLIALEPVILKDMLIRQYECYRNLQNGLTPHEN